MKRNRIITYGRPKAQNKFKPFFDSCERLIKEKGALHKMDLIHLATNKKGMPMRCGVPMSKGFHLIMRRDDRFVYVGDGVWDLAQREVEV